MSLIQEFKYQVEALNNADFQVITGRLVALLDWMESKSEIKKILDGLRVTGRGKELISKAGWHHPPQANTNEDIAAVGLEVIYLCREDRTELWNVAMSHGIQAHDSGNSIGPHSDKALTNYIEPALNYILRRLPPEEPAIVAGHVAQLPAPVAIQESLHQFKRDHPDSRKACFIMMRFGDTIVHQAIESAIKKSLSMYGFTGLLARDKEYHDDLYPNIQTYMHACGFGIAVFERIESDEFNPNVSLEVGYMLGLKKLVLLLKDKTLPTLHADLVGKLYRSFEPDHSEETIGPQIEEWLEDKGLI